MNNSLLFQSMTCMQQLTYPLIRFEQFGVISERGEGEGPTYGRFEQVRAGQPRVKQVFVDVAVFCR
jgi:hypothetical protein